MSKIVSTFVIAIAVTLVSLNVTASSFEREYSSSYLAEGSEFSFKIYMNQNAKRFIKKNTDEWSEFNNVVRLFNQSQGQFLNLSETKKAEFLKASSEIKTYLNKKNNANAQEWSRKVELTEAVYEFLWNTREHPLELPENITPPSVSPEQI